MNDSQIAKTMMDMTRMASDVMIYFFVFFFSLLMIVRHYIGLRKSDNVIYEAFRIIKTSRKKKSSRCGREVVIYRKD